MGRYWTALLLCGMQRLTLGRRASVSSRGYGGRWAGLLPYAAKIISHTRHPCLPSLSQAVINFSFPLTTEDYVHRIGRTGRAGKTGASPAAGLSLGSCRQARPWAVPWLAVLLR
jgi:hypothetical protein